MLLCRTVGLFRFLKNITRQGIEKRRSGAMVMVRDQEKVATRMSDWF